jgi:hypothetical protein
MLDIGAAGRLRKEVATRGAFRPKKMERGLDDLPMGIDKVFKAWGEKTTYPFTNVSDENLVRTIFTYGFD